MNILDMPIEIVWNFVPLYRDLTALRMTCRHFYENLEGPHYHPEDIFTREPDAMMLQFTTTMTGEIKRRIFEQIKRDHILMSNYRLLGAMHHDMQLKRGTAVVTLKNSSLYNGLKFRKYESIDIIGCLEFFSSCGRDRSLNDIYSRISVHIVPTCFIDKSQDGEYEKCLYVFGIDPINRMFKEIGSDTYVLPDINTSIGSLTIEDIEYMEEYGDDLPYMYKSFTFSIFVPKGSSKKEIMQHIDKCDNTIRSLIRGTEYEMITKPDIVM